MNIFINSYALDIQEGDCVDVTGFECPGCGVHHLIEVTRGERVVHRCGDYVIEVEHKDEIIDGVEVKE